MVAFANATMIGVTMRLATIFAMALFLTLSVMLAPVLAQGAGKDSCKSLCDCNALECTDFCTTSSCGVNGACKRRFQALVKQCEKACDRCMKLQKQRSMSH